tara:strand:- start:126 stop:1103 length:978 start_codon:yes stop_codon:yes gene_type:complete
MNSFNKLIKTLENEMDKVNEIIYERMNSKSAPRIPEITKHLIDAGGKRIRPLLTIASSQLFNYTGDNHFKLAATVEFIHTATLLHDDVIDESSKRRGKTTANLLWDNKSSVLVGDYLFAKSFELMVETNSIDVLNTLSSASAKISESEIIQLSKINDVKLSLNNYMDIIGGKTASLFSAACEVGGIISNANKKEINHLKKFGNSIGLGFQIIDDLLDYDGDDSLGKNIGDDFREQKITLPVILSLKKNNINNNNFWKKAFTNKELNHEDFLKAKNILQKDGSLEDTKKVASKFIDDAKKSLKELPNGEINALLNGLASEIILRFK